MTALLAMCGLAADGGLSSGRRLETQRPFAVVIVAGMVTTLFVALFLVPGALHPDHAETADYPGGGGRVKRHSERVGDGSRRGAPCPPRRMTPPVLRTRSTSQPSCAW